MSIKKFNLLVKDKLSSFDKVIEVDPDKSISIRSFLIGAISEKVSYASNILESEDVLSAIQCLKKLGVKIKKIKKKNYLIYGKGLGSLIINKNKQLNFGNSGTLARLLLGILSTTPGISVRISGDKSLNKRSMKSLIKLMSKFGATFLPEKKYNFPLKLISSNLPVGIKYQAGVSAQLKSAVIFVGLNSYGKTTITEISRSRDHTENILANSSEALKVYNNKKIIMVIGKKFRTYQN